MTPVVTVRKKICTLEWPSRWGAAQDSANQLARKHLVDTCISGEHMECHIHNAHPALAVDDFLSDELEAQGLVDRHAVV